MRSFYEKYKGGDYSQNGEAGIIDECLKRLKLTKGQAVEFGAPTKSYCSNIFHLGPGWRKIYLDSDPQEAGIVKQFMTPENINDLPACQILSIDVDGSDWSLWFAYNGKPDVLVIEINSSLSPMIEHYSPHNGSSYITMLNLGIAKGYFLLCHSGNMIFVKNEHRHLFPEIEGDGIVNYSDYFLNTWL